MLTFKEKLAAKKLEAEQATQLSAYTTAVEVVQVVQQPAEIKTEVSNKPLTLAEKLALRRKEEASAPPIVKPEIFALGEVALAVEDENAGTVHSLIQEQSDITVADIVPRIRSLNDLSQADLKNEMSLLKNALLANPEAVAHLLPTDVGDLVKAARKLLGMEIVESVKTKGKKEKTSKLPAAEIMSTEDILGLVDF